MILKTGTVLPTGIDANSPRIGWHNIVTPTNLTATSTASGYPASNAGLPVTYLFWRGGGTSSQSIRINLASSTTINYIAIARHNLGSTNCEYTLQSSTNGGSSWSTIDGPFAPTDDYPIIHEFTDAPGNAYRILITPDAAAPEIGIIYMGDILRLERKIYVGHTPYPFARQSVVSSGYSESGQFLGRILRRETYAGNIQVSNLTPAFVRDDIEPFLDHAQTLPFFWSWRGSQYENEDGFIWQTGDPAIVNSLSNGMMTFSMSYQGVR